MSSNVKDAVAQVLQTNPSASNEAVAAAIREMIPGANTTPSSVASIKSRLRQEARMAGGGQAAQGGGDMAPVPSWLLPGGNVGDMIDNEEETETVEEAASRINVRYKALVRNATRIVAGRVPALIVSGPPGLGKSHEFRKQLKASSRLNWLEVPPELVYEASQEPEAFFASWGDGEQAQLDHEAADVLDPLDPDPDNEERIEAHANSAELAEMLEEGGRSGDLDKRGAKKAANKKQNITGFYDIISGSITAVGLYQALWNMRKGGVLLLDDVDDVFRDETSLNLLKAALDSDPEHRHISWRKEAKWLEEYGIPKTFLFEGHVVFLTNVDFERVIEKGHRDAEHFKALIDRSHYLCLTLRTQRDFMIRIRQVAIDEGMLTKHHGLTPEQAEEILAFIDDHKSEFYNISLRLVAQTADAYKDDPEGWREDIISTKTRTMKRVR